MALFIFLGAITWPTLSFANSLSRCDWILGAKFSAPSASNLTPFERSVKHYLDEVRSKKKLSDGLNWPLRVIVRSPYVKNTIEKLQSSLQGLLDEHPTVDPRVVNSASVLQTYTSTLLKNFEQSGLSYNSFLRLSELYTWHFEFFSRNQIVREILLGDVLQGMAGAPLKKFNDFGTYQGIPSTDADWPLLADSDQVERYLNAPFVLPVFFGPVLYALTPRMNLAALGKNPYVFVPTFEPLDLEPIVWGQANRAAFLGLTTTEQYADSRSMGPRTFFEHDLLHFFGSIRANSVDPWLWSRLSATLREHRKMDRRRSDLQMAFIFYLVHERKGNLDCEQNFSELTRHEAFHLMLAARFASFPNERKPGREEALQALKYLKKTIRQLCW